MRPITAPFAPGASNVASRGELVATLFAEHYRPALHEDGAPVTHVQY